MLSHGLRVESHERGLIDMSSPYFAYTWQANTVLEYQSIPPIHTPGALGLTCIVSLSTVLEKYYDCPTHKVASYPMDW